MADLIPNSSGDQKRDNMNILSHEYHDIILNCNYVDQHNHQNTLKTIKMASLYILLGNNYLYLFITQKQVGEKP